MLKKLFLIVNTLITCIYCLGQDVQSLDYSGSGINDSLKKDAHAVYRLNEAIVQIISPSHYKFKTHKIITILDRDGADYLYQRFITDKFYKINDINIQLYNTQGI